MRYELALRAINTELKSCNACLTMSTHILLLSLCLLLHSHCHSFMVMDTTKVLQSPTTRSRIEGRRDGPPMTTRFTWINGSVGITYFPPLTMSEGRSDCVDDFDDGFISLVSEKLSWEVIEEKKGKPVLNLSMRQCYSGRSQR